MSWYYSRRVAPFGNLGIIACLQLPQAVSPLTASFIAWHNQVSLHKPFVAWPKVFPFFKRFYTSHIKSFREPLLAKLCSFTRIFSLEKTHVTWLYKLSKNLQSRNVPRRKYLFKHAKYYFILNILEFAWFIGRTATLTMPLVATFNA